MTPFRNDLFAVAYTTYYFLGLTLGGLLFACGAPTHGGSSSRSCSPTIVSYAGYFVIPGLGPRVTLGSVQTVSVHDTRISKAIDDTLNASSTRSTTSSPRATR